MNTYELTITGNLKNTKGNPIPYTRMNGRAVTEQAQTYMEWQQWVRALFGNKYPRMIKVGKTGGWAAPIDTDKDLSVSVEVYYSGEVHGDLDNIVKGLLDALIKNDKHVMFIGARATHSDCGSVTIKITELLNKR